jgi:hypothetical protein
MYGKQHHNTIELNAMNNKQFTNGTRLMLDKNADVLQECSQTGYGDADQHIAAIFFIADIYTDFATSAAGN